MLMPVMALSTRSMQDSLEEEGTGRIAIHSGPLLKCSTTTMLVLWTKLTWPTSCRASIMEASSCMRASRSICDHRSKKAEAWGVASAHARGSAARCSGGCPLACT